MVGQSWKAVFTQWYHDYGKYINVYPAISKAWDQIEAYTQKNCPAIFSSLQGASKSPDSRHKSTANNEISSAVVSLEIYYSSIHNF